MRIAVAGGTGTVGTHVVSISRERGHDVVVLTRSAGVDLMTGAGLDAALEGVDAVVDVASTFTQSAKVAAAFFGTVTRALLAAEKRQGVPHHVALSIVGIDGSRYGYYIGKQEQERAITAGGVAGVGTVALIDAAFQPCRGFHALFGANKQACANGEYVGERPTRRIR